MLSGVSGRVAPQGSSYSNMHTVEPQGGAMELQGNMHSSAVTPSQTKCSCRINSFFTVFGLKISFIYFLQFIIILKKYKLIISVTFTRFLHGLKIVEKNLKFNNMFKYYALGLKCVCVGLTNVNVNLTPLPLCKTINKNIMKVITESTNTMVRLYLSLSVGNTGYLLSLSL